MPPIVAAAAITGLASVGSGVMANRAQSGANRRSLEASERGSQRAEAFEREQDALQRADDERRESEDRRRFDIDQQNIAAERAEQQARQQYEDRIRYQRMVNIAQLTGQPVPPPPPFGGGQPQRPPQGQPQGGMPLRQLSRPPVSLRQQPASRAQALIQSNTDPMFDPLAGQRMPLSRLSGTR